MDWDDPRFKEWRRRNAAVLGVTAAIVGDHLLREYLIRRGLTPFGIFIPVIVARLGVEVAGNTLAYVINGQEGIEDWMFASNKMFSWWGYEDSMLGAPLNLVPNPVMVTEVVMDSLVVSTKHAMEDTGPSIYRTQLEVGATHIIGGHHMAPMVRAFVRAWTN